MRIVGAQLHPKDVFSGVTLYQSPLLGCSLQERRTHRHFAASYVGPELLAYPPEGQVPNCCQRTQNQLVPPVNFLFLSLDQLYQVLVCNSPACFCICLKRIFTKI
jgi:hypothetical protein